MGIIIQKRFSFDVIVLVIPAAVCALILLLLIKKENLLIIKTILAVTIITIIGSLYFKVYNINRVSYPFNQVKLKSVEAFGSVSEMELFREYEIRFKLKTDSIKIEQKRYNGSLTLLCRLRDQNTKKLDSLYDIIANGNKITVSGTISKGREQRNPYEFDYQKYLENYGITGLITVYDSKDVKILDQSTNHFEQFIFNIRRKLDEKIKELHNPQTAALLKGLLIGDRSDITDDVNTDFINSGVMHILAISGQHVVYILIIFVLIFGRFNVYVRSFFTALGVLLFLFISGASPSVFRAVLMALIVITGYITNRSVDGFNAIAVSALILLLIEPNDLFDPGFQLSYSAVLGLLTFGRYFTNKINSFKVKGILKALLLLIFVSFAAQIGTLPYTLFYFGKLSVVGLLANIIIVPVSGIIIVIGAVSLFVSPFSFWCAKLYAVVNDILCYYTLQLVKLMGEWRYAYVAINQFTLFDFIIANLFLIILVLYFNRFQNRKAKITFVALIFANIFLFASLDKTELLPQNKLGIIMIDVGQGDAFLVKFPNGKTALIDAGDANAYFDNGEKVILPLLERLGVSKIDYGFISHLDSDHSGGFVSLIKHNKIGEVYKPTGDVKSFRDTQYEKYLNQHNVKFTYYDKNIIRIGNVNIYFLNNNNDAYYKSLSSNDLSGVLMIKYGQKSFLFTGDIEKKEEHYLAVKYGSFLKSDLLKAPHHGSKTSSSFEFLKYVKPEYALISDGIQNKFGHPHDITIQKLKYFSTKIFRTDLMGAVILNSDGYNINRVNWQ